MEYELKKLAELKEFAMDEFNELEQIMFYQINDDNKSELINDTSFCITNNINKLEILQSQHQFLSNSDVIKCNRLMFLINKIIRNIEV